MTTTFEDRLLVELRREVRLAAAAQPTPAPRRFVTPRRIALGATAAAAVTGAVIAGLPGTGATPAYAMEHNPDGSITLTIPDLDAISSREAMRNLADDLEEAGLSTLIDPQAVLQCGEDEYTPLSLRDEPVIEYVGPGTSDGDPPTADDGVRREALGGVFIHGDASAGDSPGQGIVTLEVHDTVILDTESNGIMVMSVYADTTCE
ncbi:hypothetical protein [Streptomyces litchfieldiae]|uniref:Uncharacterized protein n=1 Tax=Streptomyces litchfieldiae TaxID=3075543 RepID=A0ABU2N104_9ACTN|nr:hypothetical protein [Streptomyces sp. DSM 44938]MDT0347591.1 hypothetical protein [Streptomyces sp. DSM 44938]